MSKQIRIAYFLGAFPKISNTFINDEIRQILGRCYEVEVYSLKIFDFKNVEDILSHKSFLGVFLLLEIASVSRVIYGHVYCLTKFFRAYLSLWVDALLGRVYWKSFVKFIGVVPFIAGRDIDVIYCHFLEAQAHIAYVVFKILGVPYILKTHGTDVLMHDILKQEVRLINTASRVLAVDCVSGEKLKSLPGVRVDKIKIHRCGIDSRLFKLSLKNDLKSEQILFVGRIVEHKGVYVLLDACKLLADRGKDFDLLFVGDGPERIGLENRAVELQLKDRVVFLGSLTPEKVRDCYKTAALLALPSTCEGAPIVIMEAMAMGVPVVSTRVAGIPDMIDDGVNGFLVDCGNIAALADRIQSLLSDETMRLNMGVAAKEKSKEFDIAVQTDALLKIVNEVLAGCES